MKATRWTRWGAPPVNAPERFSVASVEALTADLKRDVPAVAGAQMRHFAGAAKVEQRAKGFTAGRTIRGLCIPYGILTADLGGFRERYEPGSFGADLKTVDVRCLICNNPEKVLGRKSAGTLTVEERRDGVHCEVDCPQTQFGDDLLTSMRRGDVDEMTALFYIMECHWDQQGADRIRVVTRGKLIFASVSTFSAINGSGCDVDEAMKAARAAGYREGVRTARTAVRKRGR